MVVLPVPHRVARRAVYARALMPRRDRDGRVYVPERDDDTDSMADHVCYALSSPYAWRLPGSSDDCPYCHPERHYPDAGSLADARPAQDDAHGVVQQRGAVLPAGRDEVVVAVRPDDARPDRDAGAVTAPRPPGAEGEE